MHSGSSCDASSFLRSNPGLIMTAPLALQPCLSDNIARGVPFATRPSKPPEDVDVGARQD